MGRYVILLLALLLLACVKREAVAPASTALVWPVIREVPVLRLPPGVTPVSQAIELNIDPNDDWYFGHTEIDVDVAAATSLIWINGHDLRVSSVTVTPAGGAELRADYTEHDGSGFASIRTLQPVPAGKARIALRFGAPLPERARLGLYRVEHDGRWYVFSQLQPIAARSVFPCFDEPGFKIPYDVSVVVPRDMRVVANTRQLSRVPVQQRDRVVFATTEKLPTYAVAIAIGNFDVVEAQPIATNAVRTTPLPLRAFTTKGRGEDASFALAQVGPLLATLEEYTGIGYPYDKLDIIGVPDKNGAMENPGAITMNESLMLHASESDFVRRLYTEMLAHELAHMWVGNLVTLAWWDDVWLNEGFATWLGAKAVHAWDAALAVHSNLARDVDLRLERDELETMRAIREPIRSDADIEAAFDHVAYEKGAGVLMMFERWAGPEAWQRAVRSYLQRHRGGSATTSDFAAQVGAALGTDIEAALESFVNRRGAPAISFALQCSPSGGQARIALAQAARAWRGSQTTERPLWGIPLCVQYGGSVSGDACTLLTGRDGALVLPESVGCPAWILPNADGAGYYRSSLSRVDHLALRKYGFDALTDDQQTRYVDNLLADYRAGGLSFADTLEILQAGRLHPRLLQPLMTLLAEARSFLAEGPLQARVERHARGLFGPALRPLGYNYVKGEKRENGALRWQLLDALSAVGRDATVRAEARRRAARYFASDGEVRNEEKLLGPFWSVALTIAGEDADGARVEVLLRNYETAPTRSAQLAIRTALARVERSEAVEKVLASEFVESIAEEQMLVLMMEDARGSPLAASSWRWLTADDASLLRGVIEREGAMRPAYVVEKLCDDQRVAEAERLLLPLVADDEYDQATVSEALAKARMCVAARKIHEPEMRAYFESK